MSNNEQLNSVSERIDAVLSVEMKVLERKIPFDTNEIKSALNVISDLKNQYSSDKEVLQYIKEKEEWLKEGKELYKDSNALPDLVLNEMSDYATLTIDNANFPSSSEELAYWKYLLNVLDKCNPDNESIKESIIEYKEFLSYFDGNVAVDMANGEIINNIYTGEGEEGAKFPANKNELIQAMLLAVDPEDFNDLTPETIESLNIQRQGFDYQMEKLNVTQDDLDNYMQKLKEKSQSGADDNGLVPHEGINAKTNDLIDQMYMSLSYVDKEGDRYATSLEEANRAEQILLEAEKSIEDGSDAELMEIIQCNKEHIADARTRKFTGAWWLIICASIVAVFSFYQAYKTMGSRLTEQSAANILNSQIKSYEGSVARYEAKANPTDKDKEILENMQEKLAEYREMTPSDYASDYKSRKIRSGLSGMFWALIGMAWIFAYYFAARPYGYMRFKRQREYQVIQKATGWGAKLVGGILGIFWSMPITTYVTKYTDGTEERENDAIFVLGIQIFVTIVIIGAILYLSYVIIPIAAIIAYIRNYPQMPGAKQVNGFFKGGGDLISNYINKIKGKK